MNTKLQKQVNSVMAFPLVMIFDGSHENAVSLETESGVRWVDVDLAYG